MLHTRSESHRNVHSIVYKDPIDSDQGMASYLPIQACMHAIRHVVSMGSKSHRLLIHWYEVVLLELKIRSYRPRVSIEHHWHWGIWSRLNWVVVTRRDPYPVSHSRVIWIRPDQ